MLFIFVVVIVALGFDFIDATYFSAGFYKLPDVSRDIGRNYNITFQTVTFDEATSQLTLQRRLSIKDDPHWWNCKYL